MNRFLSLALLTFGREPSADFALVEAVDVDDLPSGCRARDDADGGTRYAERCCESVDSGGVLLNILGRCGHRHLQKIADPTGNGVARGLRNNLEKEPHFVS